MREHENMRATGPLCYLGRRRSTDSQTLLVMCAGSQTKRWVARTATLCSFATPHSASDSSHCHVQGPSRRGGKPRVPIKAAPMEVDLTHEEEDEGGKTGPSTGEPTQTGRTMTQDGAAVPKRSRTHKRHTQLSIQGSKNFNSNYAGSWTEAQNSAV